MALPGGNEWGIEGLPSLAAFIIAGCWPSWWD